MELTYPSCDTFQVTSRQDRFMGLHFFNPVIQMRAVEVITTKKTCPHVVDTVAGIITDVGKLPVHCQENKVILPYVITQAE